MKITRIFTSLLLIFNPLYHKEDRVEYKRKSWGRGDYRGRGGMGECMKREGGERLNRWTIERGGIGECINREGVKRLYR